MSPPHGGFNPEDPNQQIVAEDIFDEYGGETSVRTLWKSRESSSYWFFWREFYLSFSIWYAGFLGGVDLPELLTNFSSSKPKKKSGKSKHKRSLPSSPESGDHRERGSSSFADKLRRSKKKHKRSKQKHSESSSSESSDDGRYQKRSRRRRHHHSSSSEVSDSGKQHTSKHRHRHPHPHPHRHHHRHRHQWNSSNSSSDRSSPTLSFSVTAEEIEEKGYLFLTCWRDPQWLILCILTFISYLRVGKEKVLDIIGRLLCIFSCCVPINLPKLVMIQNSYRSFVETRYFEIF